LPPSGVQRDLFAEPAAALPEGFTYAPDIISPSDEQALVHEIERLPFKEFEFHGFLGKRRVVPFGWRYDFIGGSFQKIEPIPDFLDSLRQRAALFAGLPAASIEHALLTEYRPGAAIGWHRDRPVFDDVIGISLLSPCIFRFRRASPAGWARRSMTADPRSIYLLRGQARTEWEHSIPAVDALRYSVTFRTLKQKN
jgi:alkylated DNA repair dioxygenase AlkB